LPRNCRGGICAKFVTAKLNNITYDNVLVIGSGFEWVEGLKVHPSPLTFPLPVVCLRLVGAVGCMSLLWYVFMCSNATVSDSVTVKTATVRLTVLNREAEAVTIATPSLRIRHVSVAMHALIFVEVFSPSLQRSW